MKKYSYDEAQKEAKRKYYLKNKDDYARRNREKRERMREWLREQKNKPCMDCGIKYHPYVMDFDHRDPSQKLYQPHQLIKRLSWKQMKVEIAKCDLVCSNCHRLRTLSQMETKVRQNLSAL